ncbi:MAG TPA: HAMP domain-containing sensor histidine kinase [Roseiarcus sp.]
MRRNRLLRTASFRLAALYLALFAASTIALGAFVYRSIRHEILVDFDQEIVEERDALQHIFDTRGRDALIAVLNASAASGAHSTAALWGPDAQGLGGDMELQTPAVPRVPGWFNIIETDTEETPGREPETTRALATRLSDGSTLIVADELGRPDEILRRVIKAFVWGLGATIALGAAGGLWLSAQFLRRIDVMRRAAQGIMAGDWSRRIPIAAVEDDLSALARTFNRLFNRIETLLLANKHVSADIAHDLRKPLSRVLRRLETARSGEGVPAATASAIEGATAEVEGVLQTFDALLRIGQIEAGARRARFQPLDLADIARDVADAFRPTAEEQGRALVMRLDEPLPLQGDRELLTQMIANCLDNALTHTPPGVGIEIEGTLRPAGLKLTVADHGPGVPREDLAKLLEPFFRGDASRTSPGSGLGLSLVAAVAELHGLACSVSDNNPGLRIVFQEDSRTD